MRIESVQEQGGGAAQRSAEGLQGRQQQRGPVLDREREYAELQRAARLLLDEFDAGVEVRLADPDDDLAGKARPGKSGVHIS